MRTHFVIASVAWQSYRRSKAVRRRVFNLIEIATSLDELGMSGRSSQAQIKVATRDQNNLLTIPDLSCIVFANAE